MNRIRVVYAYTGFYRDAGGEMLPLLLAQRLDHSRFDFRVAVIEPTTSLIGAELKETGCPFYELDLPTPNLRRPSTVLRSLWAFYRLFRRLRPHIVVTQSPPANLLARTAAKWAGVRVLISTENWIRPPEPPQRLPIPYIRSRWSRWIDRHSSAILAASQHIVQLKEEEQEQDQSKTPVVLSPAPFELKRFLAGRAELPESRRLTDPSRPIIGVIGRLDRQKGQTYAIAAMPRIVDAIPEARMRIVGAGPEEHALRERVACLNLEEHVTFLGFQRDVCGEMAGTDIMLLPSLEEAFGLVLVEAMAMGLPIIATRVGGVPDVLHDGAFGRLVDPRNSEELSNAVLHALAHREETLTMADRARDDSLARYSAIRFVEQNAALYERLVAELP
ncbi:MAG: glycosyltransferase [Alphaproteobacteria bacterium]|nr:glycosyltransferase [Alphaproteobacteria bacterium]